MTDINSMKCDLQQLYIRYDELTSSGEDKELRDYNEQLLESITEAQHYINTLEELLKKHMCILETIQNTSIRADCTICKHENEDICYTTWQQPTKKTKQNNNKTRRKKIPPRVF